MFVFTIAAVEQPPTARIEPRFLTVNVGEPVSFRCVATGSPRPTIEWTASRGGRISPDAIIEHGVLRFEAANREYEGEYTCTVRNRAGQAEVHTILYVKGGEEHCLSAGVTGFDGLQLKMVILSMYPVCRNFTS